MADNMNYIDLRSDTVTKPTPEMREYMAQAPVGDDVYGEDPMVNQLQDYAAELLGKEAALFVPSGVMGNQIGIAIHTRKGDEVIAEAESHIFHYETGGPSIIAGIQLHCVPSENGCIPPEAIIRAIRPGDYYFPRTSLICLENTHNRLGGNVLPLNYLYEISALAHKHQLAFHCDGARLWNACAATSTSPAAYAEPFDTLSVCLSKGLGAPAGSILVGSKNHIEAARKWRKILGGGMRQAGILAAAGLFALKNHRDLLVQDHLNAKAFANALAQQNIFQIFHTESLPQTNIVLFGLPESVDTSEFLSECRNMGILFSAGRPGCIRAVFHFQVNALQSNHAAYCAIQAVLKLMEKHNN
jgi:threonine aldolase